MEHCLEHATTYYLLTYLFLFHCSILSLNSPMRINLAFPFLAMFMLTILSLYICLCGFFLEHWNRHLNFMCTIYFARSMFVPLFQAIWNNQSSLMRSKGIATPQGCFPASRFFIFTAPGTRIKISSIFWFSQFVPLSKYLDVARCDTKRYSMLL